MGRVKVTGPTYVFRKQIEDLFGVKLNDYSESPQYGIVTFSPDENGVTFAELTGLAAILGTDQINFRPGHRTGYCETCAGYEPAEIRASEVQFPTARKPEPPTPES